jgi:adenylosuccinate lyase
MITPVEKGRGRQDAHELLRTIAMESHDKEKPFRPIREEQSNRKKYLKEKEIDAALDPDKYIGTAVEQVEKVVKELS